MQQKHPNGCTTSHALQDMTYSRIKSLVNEELKSYFRPEFLNRLDETIVFRQVREVGNLEGLLLV